VANIQSALKRIRQTAKRTERNRDLKTRMRTHCKQVVAAVEAGDVVAAGKAMRRATSVLAISARKGIIHSSQASRRTRRLSSMVKKLALSPSS